ncbi:cation:proton antiporter regulatory subunit [Fictibacillus phosphorivorans]|uniref:cation:proton antiporter regulatory subunit n=1 Tax=Fictibacillus phosphorivorans TaxID=1221500 RepID=UPI00203C68E5|nr:cation:proton antiporter regulatory subunit [Fictibacillus phosphorivorans]MCM3718067.1 cation:proton antiporter regulatory subunit [Fictibacillus phosphorivorans]MCM3775694.1 cation:proton antiporter regulatory subunit [Fictibacillus phosphorivorans]
MIVKEIELPGIGRKFEVEIANGDKVVVIIHDDGRREIYHFDKEDYEESLSSVTLSDTEARQFAAIIGGMIYRPKAIESIEMAFDELMIEWYKIERGAYAVNKTIGELDIRQQYEISVIAIVKGNEKVLNPGPETMIHEGDMIVLSGERAGVKKIIKEMFSTEVAGE